MPSASPEPAPRRLAGRLAMGGLVAALASLAAGSTATEAWILGTERLPLVAFLGALVVVVLALTPLRLRWALPLSLLLGIPVSLLAAGWDPWQAPSASLRALRLIVAAIRAGAAGDSPFPDFLFDLVFWGNSAWLGWIVLRARRPLYAIVPSAAIIATNILEVSAGQVGFVLGLIACSCALLLVSAYERSLDDARRRHLWLNDDVRWNFWEMGLVVTILVLAITAFVPPVSTVNRTVALQNELFHGINALHGSGSGQSGTSPGGGRTIGYTTDVRLVGPLRESSQVVFTYASDLNLPEPYYFSGNVASTPVGGAWVRAGGDRVNVLRGNTKLAWSEPDQQVQLGQFQVTVEAPPEQAPSTIFYPGQLEKVSIPARLLVRQAAQHDVVAVEGAQATRGIPKHYRLTVAGSIATTGMLEQASSSYPAWVTPFAQPLAPTYLAQKVLDQVHRLALRATANVAADPYDQAIAVQSYLRANYRYTLKPKKVPRGEEPLEAFLDGATGGYCVYFATAMADMLRSLGVPVVLENGFGAGTYDPKTGQYVVRASDAHTWPEVFFPSYGWIAFEPTPQPGYGPIQRGATPSCTGASCVLAPVAGGVPGQGGVLGHDRNTAGGRGGVGGRSGPGFPVGQTVAGGLLLLLLVALAGCVWWLRPRSLAAIWRRTGRLARLAGIPVSPAESPLEFGRRLGAAVPSAREAARALADHVTVAAYAPPGTDPPRGVAAEEAWPLIRGRLLRLVVRRGLRRGRPLGAG